jgi:hypothetical protein
MVDCCTSIICRSDRAACDLDLEGIVAKWAHGSYQTDSRGTSWLKIKNPDYSQMVDRNELFDEPGRHDRSGGGPQDGHRPAFEPSFSDRCTAARLSGTGRESVTGGVSTERLTVT